MSTILFRHPCIDTERESKLNVCSTCTLKCTLSNRMCLGSDLSMALFRGLVLLPKLEQKCQSIVVWTLGSHSDSFHRPHSAKSNQFDRLSYTAGATLKSPWPVDACMRQWFWSWLMPWQIFGTNQWWFTVNWSPRTKVCNILVGMLECRNSFREREMHLNMPSTKFRQFV